MNIKSCGHDNMEETLKLLVMRIWQSDEWKYPNMKLNILNSRQHEDAINLLCQSEESWWLTCGPSVCHSLLADYLITQVRERRHGGQGGDAVTGHSVLPRFRWQYFHYSQDHLWRKIKTITDIWRSVLSRSPGAVRNNLANMTPHQRPRFPRPSAPQGPQQVESACSTLFRNYRANCPGFSVTVEKLNWRKTLTMSNCRL